MTQPRKYACKDGDLGLAKCHGYLKGYMLVVRRNGIWVTYEGGSQAIWDRDETVFRLTGWTADGPTEQWTEPTYVDAYVGMRVYWVTDGAPLGPPPAPDQDEHVLTIDHFYMDGENQCARAVWPNKKPGYADDAWSHLTCFRCATTGRPLKLKETA